MPRGGPAVDGATRVSPNGYHYTKEDGKWRLTHHLIAETKILGRALQPWERVIFADRDRTNRHPNNLRIMDKSGTTPEKKIAMLDQQIAALERLKVEIADAAKLTL